MHKPQIKVPFIWIEPQPRVVVPDRLTFRPVPDVPEDDFLMALRLSLSDSLDRVVQAELLEFGIEELTRQTAKLEDDHYDYLPSWWHLAYTPGDDLVGFLQPVVFRGCRREGKEEGTINNYGIVPPHRGKGYARDLVLKATAVLQEIGVWRIFCDTDEYNVPSMKALLSAGYEIASQYPEFDSRGPWKSAIRTAADIRSQQEGK